MNHAVSIRIASGIAALACAIIPAFALAQMANSDQSNPSNQNQGSQELSGPMMQGSMMSNPMSMGTSSQPHLAPWMMGSSTASTTSGGMRIPPCLPISRHLGPGSQGTDVKELQQALAQDPTIYPQGSVTGYYGSATAAAVAKLQEQFGIASTSSGGLGEIGPKTRTFFGMMCPMHGQGGGMGTSTPPMMGSSTMPKMPWTGSSSMPWMGTSTMPMFPWMHMMPNGKMGVSSMLLPIFSTPPMQSNGSTSQAI